MLSYQTRMPYGVPGRTLANQELTAVAQIFNPATPFLAYGQPGKIVANRFVPLQVGDAASVIYGFLIAPYPTTDFSYPQNAFGSGTPPTIGSASVMQRGMMSVRNQFGTPSLTSPVYVRIAATAGNRVLGGIEAQSDPGNNVVIPLAFFRGGADAQGNAGIAYNI